MPILGKTDRNSAPRRWVRLGTIRKGKIEGGQPVDLDYFRFVPKKGPDEDELTHIWNEVYGSEPTKIEILLPFETVEDNWQTWMESYGTTGLKFRCNGKYWVQWLDENDLTYHRDYATAQQKLCPYCSGERERTKEDPGDTEVGYLTAILIPFFERGYTGTVTVTTTSINDVMSITGSLYAIEDQARARGATLRGIPFNLVRVKEEITQRYQDKNGNFHRKRGDKSMVHLQPDPRWVMQAMLGAKRRAFSNNVSEEAQMLTVDDDIPNAPYEEIDAVVTEISQDDQRPPTKPAAPASRQVFDPVSVMSTLREHIERRRGMGFKYEKGDERHKAEWKIGTAIKGVTGNEMDTHLFLQFVVDETTYDRMDDAEIETLRKYFVTHKVDGEWVLDAAVEQEVREIVKHQREATGQKPLFDTDGEEEEPEAEAESVYRDTEGMGKAEMREYAESLGIIAKGNDLQPPSFTEKTMDAAITMMEGMLREAGVG